MDRQLLASMKETGSRPPGHRLGWLAGIVVLMFGAWVAVRWPEDLDTNIKAWLSTMVMLLGAVLVLLWFLLLGRFSWKAKLGVLVLLGLLGILARQTLRVDGTVDGTGTPRFVWKWSAAPGLPPAQSPSGTRAGVGTIPGTAGGVGGAQGEVGVLPGVIDTPQFMGPRRDGLLLGSRLGRDWSATPPREMWRQPIGAGWSAFAVVGGRAYTQEQRDEEEWVTCYALRTGAMLWAHTNRARFFQWQGGAGPRATPTVDRGRVYAIGGTGILDCLDAADGRRIWSRAVLEENGLPNLIWGVSGSPLVFDETVVVTGGMTNRATVLAYRRETGEPLWQAGADLASYASPILAKLAGRSVVLSLNASGLTAHDPAGGKVLLDFRWGKGDWPKAAQPVLLDGDRVFLSAGYTVGCVMLRVKAEADGMFSAEELWRNKRMKTQFNSAVARDGLIYGLDDGLLACVDAETGDRRWKDGRYGAGQSLVVDDLVLIQSEPGPVVLAEARPDGFRELGRLAALSSKTWNFPTLAGRYLLVRNDREAVCYELPVAGEPTASATGAAAVGVSGR